MHYFPLIANDRHFTRYRGAYAEWIAVADEGGGRWWARRPPKTGSASHGCASSHAGCSGATCPTIATGTIAMGTGMGFSGALEPCRRRDGERKPARVRPIPYIDPARVRHAEVAARAHQLRGCGERELPDGTQRSTRHFGAPVTAHAARSAGPGTGRTAAGVVPSLARLRRPGLS